MISPNMVLQSKQIEDFQQANGKSEKESSKGIFGAILNALQTDGDGGSKNLLSGMNSEEGDSNGDGDNENGAKTLLKLSTLTNRLMKAEAGEATSNIDENSEGEESNLENEQEVSQVSKTDTVTEVTGESLDYSTDDSVGSNGDEGKGKIVEDADQKTTIGIELNAAKTIAETEKAEESTGELQSKKVSESLKSNETEDGKQIRTESARIGLQEIPEVESENNNISASINGIGSEKPVNSAKSAVISEEKIVAGRGGIKVPADELKPIRGRSQTSQSHDTAIKRGGGQIFSTEKGDMRINQDQKIDKSSVKSRDDSVEQILKGGSAGINEIGFAGAAVNAKSVNIDRLREEKAKKMSTRVLNTASSGDQAKSRNSSENGSAISLFSLSGGQGPGSLNISSDEGSMEESVLFWNRFGYEGSENVDEKKSNALHLGLSRLSHIPIMNTSVRQQLLSGIAQSVQTSAGSSKTAETWQKHTFSLENGKSVQISVRQIDGVLHLKLGSTNSELTKLLQLNQQEIKDHLQNEFDIEVDLKFNQRDEGNSSKWFETMQGQKTSKRGYQTSAGGNFGNVTDGQTAGRTVRNFGYNQMEWTV